MTGAFTAVDAVRRLTEDLRLLVEADTGLTSRWSGEIVVGDERLPNGEPAYLARKLFRCDIRVHAEYLAGGISPGTLVHELLHSVSAGLDERTFLSNAGWEEAVAEWLTRERWRDIAEAAGVTDAAVRADKYDKLVAAADALQWVSGMNAEAFYRKLLATPLGDRRWVVVQWIAVANSITAREVEHRWQSPLRILGQ